MNLKCHKIYKYTNKLNDKVYIGRTCKSLKMRAGHNGSRYKGSHKFWNAIQKYGWDNFIGEVIVDNLTDEEAGELEVKFIKEYDSVNKGYNTLYDSNVRLSESYRDSISLSLQNVFKDKEKREKLSNSLKGENNPFYGKHHSEETIEKIRQKRKGQKLSKEQKEKISNSLKGEKNPFYGKHHSEETKKKIGEANKGRVCSEQTKRLRSEIRKGQIMSEETKRKISRTHKEKGAYNSKKVECIEKGKIYSSISEASRDTGISRDLIRVSCKNENKEVGGMHWRFI